MLCTSFPGALTQNGPTFGLRLCASSLEINSDLIFESVFQVKFNRTVQPVWWFLAQGVPPPLIAGLLSPLHALWIPSYSGIA